MKLRLFLKTTAKVEYRVEVANESGGRPLEASNMCMAMQGNIGELKATAEVALDEPRHCHFALPLCHLGCHP